MLENYSKTQDKLITLCVGLGKDYNMNILRSFAKAGNTKRFLYFFKSKPPEDCILELGKEKIELIIQCTDPIQLSKTFQRLANGLSGIDEDIADKI
jgi:hypothetical protein